MDVHICAAEEKRMGVNTAQMSITQRKPTTNSPHWLYDISQGTENGTSIDQNT